MEETNCFLQANTFPAKVVEPHMVKIMEHNFTGVYSSPVLMKLDARKCMLLSCFFIKLKDEVIFLCFSNFSPLFKINCWQLKSQNAIPNNFEEY